MSCLDFSTNLLFQSRPTTLIAILGRTGPIEYRKWIQKNYGLGVESARFFIEEDAFIYDEVTDLVRLNAPQDEEEPPVAARDIQLDDDWNQDIEHLEGFNFIN